MMRTAAAQGAAGVASNPHIGKHARACGHRTSRRSGPLEAMLYVTYTGTPLSGG
jgi:hypothetical protein